MFLAHHFETPVFSNDFSLWVSRALQEPALGERLAAVDLLRFASIRELREELVAVMERDAGQEKRRYRECPSGDEFYFCRSKSFILKTGLVAHEPEGFFALLPEVSTTSLFFHFFEARLRLGRPTNDFSQWLADRGEHVFAKSIDALNPYVMTLDDLRRRIMETGGRSRYS